MISYNEILNNMKNAYFDKCGENPDMQGDLGIRLQAVASELFNIALYADYTQKQSNPKTATGDNLDSIAAQCGLTRHKKTVAKGKLVFGIDEKTSKDIQVPKGTICAKNGERYIQYITTEDGVIKSGSTQCRVNAMAMGYGTDYNSKPNEIILMVNPPADVASVYNESVFSGGWDDECDEALRERIKKVLTYPANALNMQFVKSHISNIDNVLSCNLVRSGSSVRAYVKTENGTFTTDVKNQVSDALDLCKLLGVTVTVQNATAHPLDLSVTYVGSVAAERVEQLCKDYVNSLWVGEQPSEYQIEQWVYTIGDVRFCKATFDNQSVKSNEYAALDNLEVLSVDSAR